MSGSLRSSRGNARTVAVALSLIAFPILVGITYYASRKLLPDIRNFQLVSPSTTQTSHAVSASTTQIPPLNSSLDRPIINFSLPGLPFLTYSDILIIIAVALVLYVCLQGLKLLKNRLSIRPIDDIDTLDEDRQRVAEILDNAVRRLSLGSDYRDTVLKCYKSIVRVMESKSSLQSKTLTPSEFRLIVSEKLKFDSPSFSRVTSLFEVARYSENIITQGNAEEAIQSLAALSKELKSSDYVSVK